MRKLVSIIVPYKNERESQLSVVLSSINNQVGIDFSQVEVILICDGGYKLKDISIFNIFDNINIKYYYNKQSKGPGFSRQFGMNRAIGQYYMFMDADDQFHFTGSLLEFFNVVKDSGNHEVIIARYIEQYKMQDGSFRYYTHPQNDWKASYGKWFHADYIKKIGLSWLSNLKIYEDTYFVGLACELSTDIYYKNSVVYIWLCNSNSIVRNPKNQFHQQLHTWVYMNRNYFQFLRNKKFSLLQKDFNKYLVELYFKESNYKPVDKNEYDIQNQLLLKENKDLWEVYKDNLINDIQNYSKNNQKYLNRSTENATSYFKYLNNI
ncbi:glycosyltransferase family 2 protein [Leuconostoc suionicum]|uniref:glycosyltransferase family 2 protein n=1 Tax=Leuconostoc suionicum TaxID=1511761 RepID=UPI0032DED904